jgi:hypothetical protein
VVVSKPWAMSCEFTCSQLSSLIAQNTFKKKKFNNENTSAGTSSGCEQAQAQLSSLIAQNSHGKKIKQAKSHYGYREWL